jgi:[acyl-carrier-protein] S-malonyltransferase
MENIVFLFDGQGAFRPGVGKDLFNRYPIAKELINKSSDILGYDLTAWLWGEKAQTTGSKTSIAQPAISAISLAYAGVLKELKVIDDVSLGHSLGEITAIVHCGIVAFEDGIKIIKKRGELMENAGKQGSMMAVINVEAKLLEEICRDVTKEISEPVVIANINAPHQIVVSGAKEGIKKVAQLVAEKHGRGIPLKVGGAWHSPYLNDAAKEFSGFLDSIEFNKPSSKFYSVVDQKILDEPSAIKDSLKRQMLSQVNWVLAIQNIVDLGYKKYLEIGPSKILKDLVLKIDSKIVAESTALFTDLESLIRNI